VRLRLASVRAANTVAPSTACRALHSMPEAAGSLRPCEPRRVELERQAWVPPGPRMLFGWRCGPRLTVCRMPVQLIGKGCAWPQHPHPYPSEAAAIDSGARQEEGNVRMDGD
jgi:hypothetical protein